MATILVADDEKSIRVSLGLLLKVAGHEVLEAGSVDEAKQWVDRQPLDVALLDLVLGKGSGLDIARYLRDRQPDVRVILITGEPNFGSASEAIRLRIFDYLVKPVDKDHALAVVSEAAAAKVRQEEYAQRLRDREQSCNALENQVRMRTAELNQTAANLHALAAHLHVVREDERKTLARELHDNFGQNLTALQIDLQWLERRVRATPPVDGAVLAKLTSMAPLAERLTEMTQAVCAALRPGMLDDLGLLAAIEWQAEDWEKRTGLTCAVSLPSDEVVLNPDHALGLFRILQESLTNVVRHAKATRVDVRLYIVDGTLHLEVQDNGRGFSPESFLASKALGLLSMRERAAGFQGTVELHSEPGKGTTVRVRLPQAGGVGA
jgi:signal transduction histidine kinase